MLISKQVVTATPVSSKTFLQSRLLIASLRRTLFDGVSWVFNNGKEPLFQLDSARTKEFWLKDDENWPEMLTNDQVAGFEWVLFLPPGTLCLRGIDHLFDTDADVLWAPATKQTAARRPVGVEASTHIWAVRTCHLAELREIFGEKRGHQEEVKLKWQSFLCGTELKVAQFEAREVQFPAHASYLDWKDAAIINVSEWPPEAQSKFLQAQYLGMLFGDETGWFTKILDP